MAHEMIHLYQDETGTARGHHNPAFQRIAKRVWPFTASMQLIHWLILRQAHDRTVPSRAVADGSRLSPRIGREAAGGAQFVQRRFRAREIGAFLLRRDVVVVGLSGMGAASFGPLMG